MSLCGRRRGPPWGGHPPAPEAPHSLHGDSLGTPLAWPRWLVGGPTGVGGPPPLSHGTTPSAGPNAPLLPSLAVTLRGWGHCDNQDRVAGPLKAQHSPGGGEMGDSNP